MSNDIQHPFPYPGGKVGMADEILSYLPDHECYVEPFGGAGSVLVEKDPSYIEVYNDLNDDVVTFFQVLRDQPDDLIEYLDNTPYSRAVFENTKERWYGMNGRPDAPVVQAAEFFLLRRAGYGSMFRKTGFTASNKRNHAQQFRDAAKLLHDLRDRLSGVIIENRDWSAVVEKYDGAETVFYFDPPYVDIDDDGLYAGKPTDFDHESFVETLANLEARWVLSYSALPDNLKREQFTIEQVEKRRTLAGGQDEVHDVERLVMNFDPEQAPSFSGANQTTLSEVT